MVCHACHALAKTAAEVLETGRNAHLRSIDGGGLGVRWLDPVVPRRGYCGSCRGRFPPEELRPATDGNHLCEACETMILRLVKSVQAIAAAEVAGFERGRVPSGNEREDLLEDCRQYLAYNGWDLVPTIHPDTPSGTVYILTRNDPSSGPELPNPLMFDSVGRLLAFVQGLNYGAKYGAETPPG